MNNPPVIAALVPMRHHSVRVPGKNYREIGGKPLYHHILATLQQCPLISTILVDTDSDVILSGIASSFPDIQTVMRPDHLVADTIPMNDILLYDTSLVEADFYLQTHSTNPLLKAETINTAITTLMENVPAFDSLFGVTQLQTRLWDGLARPINHNPAILLRTQDLPPIYEENSCIYLFSKEILQQKRNRIGERPILFPIDRAEAFDIDEELDFLLAALMLSHQAQARGKE